MIHSPVNTDGRNSVVVTIELFVTYQNALCTSGITIAAIFNIEMCVLRLLNRDYSKLFYKNDELFIDVFHYFLN